MKSKFAIAACVITGAAVLSYEMIPPRSAPASAVSTEIRKASRPARAAEPTTAPREQDAESQNLSAWKDRYESLASQGGDNEEIVKQLKTEMDAAYGKWVADEISVLEKLPAADRYDRLADIEEQLKEGAAAVFEELGLEGGRHFSVIATALDAIHAESEYAEAAPDHASRLALLHLDRERGERLNRVVAITDEVAKTQAMGELDVWYDQSLAVVFPENPAN